MKDPTEAQVIADEYAKQARRRAVYEAAGNPVIEDLGGGVSVVPLLCDWCGANPCRDDCPLE